MVRGACRVALLLFCLPCRTLHFQGGVGYEALEKLSERHTPPNSSEPDAVSELENGRPAQVLNPSVLTVSRKQDERQPPLRRRANGGRSNAKHHARTTVPSCGGSTAAFHLLGAPPERTGRPALS